MSSNDVELEINDQKSITLVAQMLLGNLIKPDALKAHMLEVGDDLLKAKIVEEILRRSTDNEFINKIIVRFFSGSHTSGKIGTDVLINLLEQGFVDELLNYTFIQLKSVTVPQTISQQVDAPTGTRLKKLLDKPVDVLEINVRATNCFKVEDIYYIGELVKRSKEELLRIPNFGNMSLKEVESQLTLLGLALGIDVEDWVPPGTAE